MIKRIAKHLYLNRLRTVVKATQERPGAAAMSLRRGGWEIFSFVKIKLQRKITY